MQELRDVDIGDRHCDGHFPDDCLGWMEAIISVDGAIYFFLGGSHDANLFLDFLWFRSVD
jgi:hypothetical protein